MRRNEQSAQVQTTLIVPHAQTTTICNLKLAQVHVWAPAQQIITETELPGSQPPGYVWPVMEHVRPAMMQLMHSAQVVTT